jgi:ATP phosphoribosyltransferase
MPETRLTIAVQKNGRLNDESLKFLFPDKLAPATTKQQLFCKNPNLLIDIIFVRDDDIPTLVAQDICDLGIVGQNVLLERKIEFDSTVSSRINKFEIIQYLGFGNCRLSFAVPDDFKYSNIADLEGCRIATTYPYLVKKFLVEHNIDAKIIYLSGSVEIAPRLNVADLICDLVVTGTTLQQNNLCEVYTILCSEAVLFRSSALSSEKQIFLESCLMKLNSKEFRKGVCNA